MQSFIIGKWEICREDISQVDNENISAHFWLSVVGYPNRCRIRMANGDEFIEDRQLDLC